MSQNIISHNKLMLSKCYKNEKFLLYNFLLSQSYLVLWISRIHIVTQTS